MKGATRTVIINGVTYTRDDAYNTYVLQKNGVRRRLNTGAIRSRVNDAMKFPSNAPHLFCSSIPQSVIRKAERNGEYYFNMKAGK